jgi:predicted transcriptional regulator
MKAIIEIDDLKKDLRKIIKDTMQDEMMKFRAELLHYISDEEQKEIEREYKKPARTVARSIKVKI